MIKNLWFDQSPIGRFQYFKNTLVIGLIQIPFQFPSRVAEVYSVRGTPLSIGLELTFALLAIISAIFWIVLAAKNIFKRAREIEGKVEICRIKWIVFGMFPVIAIYGQVRLFFQKGKDMS